MRQVGFTLIEILVVVAVIGVLTAVLLVNITSIRERAADTKKIQKLEQFMFALRMYYNDNKKYPETGGPQNARNITGASSIYMKKYFGELMYYNRLLSHRNAANEMQFDAVVACIVVSSSSQKEIERSQAKCFPNGIDANQDNELTIYNCRKATCYCDCIF